MNGALATAERRATRRHPFYGDEPVETPLLDAIEAEKREVESAERAEREREARRAEQAEKVPAILDAATQAYAEQASIVNAIINGEPTLLDAMRTMVERRKAYDYAVGLARECDIEHEWIPPLMLGEVFQELMQLGGRA